MPSPLVSLTWLFVMQRVDWSVSHCIIPLICYSSGVATWRLSVCCLMPAAPLTSGTRPCPRHCTLRHCAAVLMWSLHCWITGKLIMWAVLGFLSLLYSSVPNLYSQSYESSLQRKTNLVANKILYLCHPITNYLNDNTAGFNNITSQHEYSLSRHCSSSMCIKRRAF